MFFHLAFWLRDQTAGTAWFGVAVGCRRSATMAGNAIAPRLRRAVREEVMLVGALALSAVAGLARRASSAASAAGVVLAVVVNFAAAVGRLAFESIVQRDAPQANRGRAFARFETRFQLGWAVAGLIPVLIDDPRPGRVPDRRPDVRRRPSPTTWPASARRRSRRVADRRRHPAEPGRGPPLPPPADA